MPILTPGERAATRALVSKSNMESTGDVRKPEWQTVIDDMDDLIDSQLTGPGIRSVEAKASFSEVLMLDCFIAVARARRTRSLKGRE